MRAQTVDPVSEPRSRAGEIVIDTFEVQITPDSARWSIVFHFENRPGNMTDYEMSLNGRRVDARYVEISPTPPLQNRIFRQGRRDSISIGLVVGDTITAECYLGWWFFDPELQAYQPGAWITGRFTKRFPVSSSLPNDL